jgi:hypothetical protein
MTGTRWQRRARGVSLRVMAMKISDGSGLNGRDGHRE